MTTDERVAKAQDLIAEGLSTAKACKRAGVSANTYYKKRRESMGERVTETNGATATADWRDFAAEGLINANIPTTFKVAAIRELYSR